MYRNISSLRSLRPSTFPCMINLSRLAAGLRGEPATPRDPLCSIAPRPTMLHARAHRRRNRVACWRARASVTLARTHGQASVTTAAVRLSVAGSRRSVSAGTRRGYIPLPRRIVRTAMKRLTYNNHTDTQDELRNAPFSYTCAHHASGRACTCATRAVTRPSIRHCDMDVRLRA